MGLQRNILLLSDAFDDLPDPNNALTDPDGLAAVGGDLSTDRLLFLYQHGFFPWYSAPDPILWWHPSKRCLLFPAAFHCSRSLKKDIRRFNGEIRINHAFQQVIQHCSDQRKHLEGTWISNEIIDAFTKLHQQGYAHSIEVWLDDRLVGGFYGIAMGELFFGESMFSLIDNASKYALYAFCQAAQEFGIEIDCQVESNHIMSLGAQLMPRKTFIKSLSQYIPNTRKNFALLQSKALTL